MYSDSQFATQLHPPLLSVAEMCVFSLCPSYPCACSVVVHRVHLRAQVLAHREVQAMALSAAAVAVALAASALAVVVVRR